MSEFVQSPEQIENCITVNVPSGTTDSFIPGTVNQYDNVTAYGPDGMLVGVVRLPIAEEGQFVHFDTNNDGVKEEISYFLKCVEATPDTSSSTTSTSSTTTTIVEVPPATTPNSSTTTSTTSTTIGTPGASTTTVPETVVSQPPKENAPSIPKVGAEVGTETALASVFLAAGLTLAGIKRHISRNRRAA